MADEFLLGEDAGELSLETGDGSLLLDDPGGGGDGNMARFSQVAVEAVIGISPRARFSQVPVEVVMLLSPTARFSQVPVEVAYRNLRESISITVID